MSSPPVITAGDRHAPEPRASADAARSHPLRRRSWWHGLGGVVLLAAALELVPRLGLVSDDYLPPLSRMLSAIYDDASSGALWSDLGDTLEGWILGFAIAALAGVALGVTIGGSRFLRAFTQSTIEFLRPIPSVALVPLAVIVFGATLQSKLLLVIYASLWPVLVQVLAGVADVDPVAQDTAQSYGLGTWLRLRHLVWPTMLPYLVTGLRLSATIALILTVTSELVIGSPGLGRSIALAQSGGAVATMYGLVIVTGALGLGVNGAMRAIAARALFWHTSVRAEGRP